jgi:hypothetical protein
MDLEGGGFAQTRGVEVIKKSIAIVLYFFDCSDINYS